MWSKEALEVKARPRSINPNFQPISDCAVSPSFPFSPWWQNLLSRPPAHVDALLYSFMGEIRFDPNECYAAAMVRNGSENPTAVAPMQLRLPKDEDAVTGETFEAVKARISPRTLFFFIEFGYLRQVKPTCGNPACVNPWHQIAENNLEKPKSLQPSKSDGRNMRLSGSNTEMTLGELLEYAHETGFGGPGFNWSRVRLVDLTNLAVAHREYCLKIGRERPTYETKIEVEIKVVE